MGKEIYFTLPFLLLCIALLACQGLGINSDDSTGYLKTNVEAEYNKMSAKQTKWWFPHPYMPPQFHWPFVHPPLPSGVSPKFPWPFVHPPLPSGGFPKFPWPHPPLPSGGGGFPKFPWPFPHPPLPSGGGFPKFPWPFPHPPLPSAGFPKFPWPFPHPPLPSGGGFPKFPWPFPHPPLPSGGSFPKFPWPFPHPPLPSGGFPFPWIPHPHGATENVNNPKCSSTSKVVESCMEASSMSHSWGYTFTPHCCKAIKEVSDECHPTIVPMIKDQCSNKATAPPPTA